MGRLLTLILVLALVLGCGKRAPSPEELGWVKLDVPAAELPSGWKEVADPDLGLRFALPARFAQMDNSQGAAERNFALLRAALPNVSEEMMVQWTTKNADMLYVNLDVEVVRAGNMQTAAGTVKENEEDWDLATNEKEGVGKSNLGPASLEGRKQTPIGEMLVVNQTMVVRNLAHGGASQQRVRLYVFGHGKWTWTVTFTYLVDVAEKMKPIEEQFVQTIRVSTPNLAALRSRRQAQNSAIQKDDEARERAQALQDETNRRMQETRARQEEERRLREEQQQVQPAPQPEPEPQPQPQPQPEPEAPPVEEPPAPPSEGASGG